MTEADVLHDVRVRSRETRTSTWTLVYGVVLLVAIVCAMTLALVHEAAGRLATGASWLPGAVTLAWGAGVLAGCLTCGPAHARPANAVWLVPAPLDRARLLRRSLAVTFTLATALGALGGLTTALVAGGGGGDFVLVPWGGLVGAAVHQLALWAQSRRFNGPLRAGAALAAAGAALVITAGCRFEVTWDVGGSAPWVAGAVAAVGAATLLVSLARWSTWLRRVGAPSLRVAGGVVESAITGAVMLDPSTFTARVNRRRGRATSVGVARFRHRSTALDYLTRDVVGVLRRGANLAVRASWIVGVWAFGAVFAPAFGQRPTVVAASVVVWGVVAIAGQGLTTWLGSSSLWRLAPTRPQVVTAVFAVTPLLVGALVAGVALAGAGMGAADAFAWGVLLAAATVAGVARRTDSPPVAFGNAVSTPLGDLEIDLVAALVHGPDVVALCLLVGALAGPQLGCVAAAGWLVRVVITAQPGGRRR